MIGGGVNETAIDTFIIGEGTDTIRNFSDGIDVFSLTGGLSFGDLTIADVGGNAEISVTATSDIIGIVEGVSASLITAADFV